MCRAEPVPTPITMPVEHYRGPRAPPPAQAFAIPSVSADTPLLFKNSPLGGSHLAFD